MPSFDLPEEASLEEKLRDDERCVFCRSQWWCSPTFAKEHFGFGYESLVRWRERGCRFLSGRKLRSIPVPKGFKRTGFPRRLLSVKDLLHIKTVRDQLDSLGPHEMWLSEAAKAIGVNKATLAKWDASCIWLGGEPLGIDWRKSPGCGQTVGVVDRRKVRRIILARKAAKNAWPLTRKGNTKRAFLSQGLYVVSHAARELGVSRTTLYRWHQIGCRYRNGEKVDFEYRLFIRGKRVYRLAFMHASDIEQIKAAMNLAPAESMGRKTMFLTDAAKSLGVSVNAMFGWRDYCLWLPDDETLDIFTDQTQPRRKRAAVYADQVDRIKAAVREAKKRKPCRNEGLWSLDAVAEELGISNRTVRKWLYKGCRYNGRQKIECVKRPVIRRGRTRWHDFMHDADVKQIKQAMKTGRVPLTNAHPVATGSGKSKLPLSNDDPTTATSDGKSASIEDLEKLRRTVPPFSETSGEWVTNREAADLESVTTRTLSDYRKTSSGGRSTPDHRFGVDKVGRIWIRPFTPSGHPWYLRKSLRCYSR